MLLHPALLIVDHIHFQVSKAGATRFAEMLTSYLQYNGFLLGILLWSIVAAREVSTASALRTIKID